MPIKSFIAFPAEGKKDILAASLASFDQCTVFPAENQDVLVLVVDTLTDDEEKSLIETLEQIESLHQLSLVAGFAENLSQSQINI